MIELGRICGGRGEFPFERGKHLIVALVFHVFGDETGIESSAQYCIIAGYIAPPREWERFRREWRRVLRKYRVPLFHAKDFFQPEKRKHIGHYKDWSDDQAAAFLDALLQIINARDITSISTAIHVPGFNSLHEEDRRFLSGGILGTHAVEFSDGTRALAKRKWITSGAPTRPYMAIFQRFLGEAVTKVEKGAKVHFTFEIQNVLQSRAIETFNEQYKSGLMEAEFEDKAASIRYAKAIDEEPLQAADLCAYYWNRNINGSVRGRLLKQMEQTLSVKSPTMHTFQREHLISILNQARANMLSQLDQVKGAPL